MNPEPSQDYRTAIPKKIKRCEHEIKYKSCFNNLDIDLKMKFT